jgi:hypothetical protein
MSTVQDTCSSACAPPGSSTDVILCASIYHLFIALMLIGRQDKRNTCLLMLTTHEHPQYLHFLKIAPRLRELGIRFEIRLRDKRAELLGIEMVKTLLQYRRLRHLFPLEGYHLINFSWNFSGPFRTSNFWYRKARSSEFFEEGAMCSATPPDRKLKVFAKKACGICTDFFRDEKLQSINVQQRARFTPELQSKIREFSINEYAASLSDIWRTKILRVFLSDEDIESIERMHGEDVVIVFTQPLSEDGFIPETHKVGLYSRLCSASGKYGQVVLKLHPRDTSHYNFPEVRAVLRGSYPSELLTLFPVHFSLAVGICTSAVVGCRANRQVNVCCDYLKTLDESFFDTFDQLIEGAEVQDH